jgi:hypothetical protein
LNEKTSLLAVAFYNLGCETEHLGNIGYAVFAYSRALDLESATHGDSKLSK